TSANEPSSPRTAPTGSGSKSRRRASSTLALRMRFRAGSRRSTTRSTGRSMAGSVYPRTPPPDRNRSYVFPWALRSGGGDLCLPRHRRHGTSFARPRLYFFGVPVFVRRPASPMTDESTTPRTPYLALLGPLVLVAVWGVVASLGFFPESLFPAPLAVARAFVQEWRSGRLVEDSIASLFRLSAGFLL